MIGACIDLADSVVGLADNAEITLEANPGTAEQEKFLGFREAGVNRLSIGVQSLNERQLNNLGRIHSASEATTAIQICLLYTSPSPRDKRQSRMPSSA